MVTVQHLGQREPGRRRIGSVMACWQRLWLASRGDERLSQQQLLITVPPGSGPCRHCQPRHHDGKLAQHPCTLRRSCRQCGGAGSPHPFLHRTDIDCHHAECPCVTASQASALLSWSRTTDSPCALNAGTVTRPRSVGPPFIVMVPASGKTGIPAAAGRGGDGTEC